MDDLIKFPYKLKNLKFEGGSTIFLKEKVNYY
jgi:hypothetical protein